MAVLRPGTVHCILLLTACAAGTVDVTSFATLGGVLASAMTGNLALLALYSAQFDVARALGSVTALVGFVAGCAAGILLRRGRAPSAALTLLLAVQTALLLVHASIAWPAAGAVPGTPDPERILLLSAAMGCQAIVGQTLSQTTIVFTTTLTRTVCALADALATRDPRAFGEVRLHASLVTAYLLGALLAGSFILHASRAAALLPPAAVAGALAIHLFTRRRP